MCVLLKMLEMYNTVFGFWFGCYAEPSMIASERERVDDE